jgi:quinol-cytochrome oxidoreductase complex cytochrome b subunit
MTENTEKTIPFYPDHLKTEARVVLAMIAIAVVFGVLGLFFPVGLEHPADPMDTPEHVKPEWYFLAVYQILKYIPKTAGALLLPLAMILALIYPFIDRKEDNKKQMRIRVIGSVIFTIALVVLTIWGQVS